MSLVKAFKFWRHDSGITKKGLVGKVRTHFLFHERGVMLHLSLAFTTPSIGFVKTSSHIAAPSEESLVFSTTRGNY